MIQKVKMSEVVWGYKEGNLEDFTRNIDLNVLDLIWNIASHKVQW